MTHDDRLKWWLSAIGAAGVLVSVGLPVLCWAHLPGRIATHWSLGGVPNGSLNRTTAMAVLGVTLVVPIALSWPRSGRPTTRPAALLGCLAFMSTLLGFVGAMLVVMNWNRVNWRQAAHLSATWVLAQLLLSSLVGFFLFKLAQRAFPEMATTKSSAPALELGQGERAFWVSGATNRWLLLITLIAAAIGAVLLATGAYGPGALHLLVAASLEPFSRIRVTVNERFVTVHYGSLGWPRQRIPVARILQVESLELVPMAHGGWGYRGGLTLFRRAAVVVRRGPALSLTLAGNRRFTVTVDDAATAAKLLRGLVQRADLRSGHAALGT